MKSDPIPFACEKTAETEPQARDRDFRAFFELSGAGNVFADFTTGCFLTVNEAFCQLTGYSAAELAHMSAADLTLPADAALDADGWRESLARGAPHFTIEKRYRRKDGAVIWVEATSTVIRDGHGTPVYVAGVVIDASARHHTLEEIGGARRALGEANAELHEISKKFSTLIEASPIAIIGLDAGERVEIWNPEAEVLFGLREAEVRGRRLVELPLHWDAPEALQMLLDSTEEARANIAVQPSSERRLELEIWSAPYRGLTDAPRGHVLLLLDETEKNFLEHALLEAGEREQRRIGQELHDHLAQQLLGAAFGAQALFKELERAGSPSASRAGDLARLINTSVLDARNMARGINPIEIDSAGLMSALQELAERSHSGAQIELRCDPPVLVHSPETSLHVFRIAQEAVNDALHHSHASRILIRLAENAGLATLQVSDNGTGSSDEDDTADIGMGIMKYRAQAIRGELSIQQTSDGGTNVTCTFANPS
jgi:PAS domain S-box-containing protein